MAVSQGLGAASPPRGLLLTGDTSMFTVLQMNGHPWIQSFLRKFSQPPSHASLPPAGLRLLQGP